MTKNEFIEAIAESVQKYAPTYGICVNSPIIAQAILESGWGETVLAYKYHNYFGMKCGTDWKGDSVNLATMEEYTAGTFTKIRDNFRAYASLDAGVKGYFMFIQYPRYSNLKGITDPRTYLETIKADGYATASAYVESNMRIINQYDLTKYDSVSKIENAVRWMERTANNDSHGYDQIYRWGEKGDYDCSSAVITACEQAGIPVKTQGATYTGNMLPVFLKCGFKDVTSQIDLEHGTGLIRGDVLLNTVHHTAMYCGHGQEVEASINEKGRATGGTPGDQTGKEFLIRPYRNYPWTNILRYVEANKSKVTITLDEAAKNTIAGLYGNGDDRVHAIEALGLDYNAVQKRVNELLAPKPHKKSVTKIAKEVIAGKWGNGDERKTRLEKAGYNYNAVQKKVNMLLK